MLHSGKSLSERLLRYNNLSGLSQGGQVVMGKKATSSVEKNRKHQKSQNKLNTQWHFQTHIQIAQHFQKTIYNIENTANSINKRLENFGLADE